MDDLPHLTLCDLDFLADVRKATRAELDVMLRWQCGEQWRRVAVNREIARRDGKPLPVTE